MLSQIMTKGQTLPPDVLDIQFRPGHPILLCVAKRFSTEEQLRGLATEILQNVNLGGPAFISGLPQDRSIALKVHDVLEEWVTVNCAEAFASTLYLTLQKQSVNPYAAGELVEELRQWQGTLMGNVP